MSCKNFVLVVLSLASPFLMYPSNKQPEQKNVAAAKSPNVQGPLIVIEIGHHEGIALLKKFFEAKINTIISEEIKKTLPDYSEELPTFKMPPLTRPFWMTLWYVGPMDGAYEPAVMRSLQLMQDLQLGTKSISDLTITQEYGFFGEAHNELVVKLEVPKTVVKLREDIQKAMENLNSFYKQTHNKDLFSLEYSLRFPFTPHITIGRLPSGGKNPVGQGTPLWENIKKRIEQELFKTIKLPAEQKTIKVPAFQLYNSSHERMHEYKLHIGTH